MITRRLTISASDKFGLPTSLDDEVILGLIQLTKQNRFADRKVNFSRYQLIQILGWRHEGRSYERLEKSLKRWLGVTLYYDKAWWDKDEQSWVDENFHILEQVTLYDQERRLKRLRSGNHRTAALVVHLERSRLSQFQVGLPESDRSRRLSDSLSTPPPNACTAFSTSGSITSPAGNLISTEFACEHIGVSRNYDTGQLKRRLQPAIDELESVGFLEALPVAQRYVKISRGEWRIVFVKKAVRAN